MSLIPSSPFHPRPAAASPAPLAVLLPWFLLVSLLLISCDPRESTSVHDETGSASPAGALSRNHASPPAPESILPEMLATLNALLQEEDAASPPATLSEELAQLPAAALWELLHWLGDAPGTPGQRTGLAVVILGELAHKDPAALARHLTNSQAPFALYSSDAGLMAFRQAMTHWTTAQPQEAFAALDAFASQPEMTDPLSELTRMHGERLEVTLVAAMPLEDLPAVTARWDHLELREAAAVLPRLLHRLPSEPERQALLTETTTWLREKWNQEGAGAVFQWALGLEDDALQQEILDRVGTSPKAEPSSN